VRKGYVSAETMGKIVTQYDKLFCDPVIGVTIGTGDKFQAYDDDGEIQTAIVVDIEEPIYMIVGRMDNGELLRVYPTALKGVVRK
jgi:hypothetical protein